MATLNTTRKAVAKAARGGKSPIAGIAAAARRTVSSTRNGPKARETDHLRPDQFAGRHHAPSSSYSVGMNVSTSMSSRNTGRHAPYEGKHRGGEDHWRDAMSVIKNGGYSYGKHARTT